MSKSGLVREILDTLRKERAELGFHIREQWLANELGVSRSPVRAALKELETHGIVVLRPSKGYFLNTGIDRESLKNLDLPQPDTERIYHLIASERFANLIGSQVSVSDLMRRYEADRAMIQKVLARMQEDGLVEKTSGHNWVFGPALNDDAAYQESYRFRILLEPAALLEQNYHLPGEELEHQVRTHEDVLASDLRNERITKLFEIDAEFHNALAGACGNRFLAQSIRQQTRLRRLSEYEKYTSRERMEVSFREHLAILDAISRGAQDEAADRMSLHIRLANENRPDFRKVRVLAHRRLTRK